MLVATRMVPADLMAAGSMAFSAGSAVTALVALALGLALALPLDELDGELDPQAASTASTTSSTAARTAAFATLILPPCVVVTRRASAPP